MVFYLCPRCHYETNQKNTLRRHYNRKRVCKTVFSRISIKDCKEHLEKKKKYNELEQRNKELEEENKKLRDCKTLTINNNIDNSINIKIVNAYKDTNYDMLCSKVNECIKDGRIDMRRLIGCVHNNKEHPENHNVYMANSNNQRILKFEDGSFNEDGRYEDGIVNFLKEVADKIEKHTELCNSDLYDLSNIFIQLITDKNNKDFKKEDKEELERIKNETISALIKCRDMVKETHKVK